MEVLKKKSSDTTAERPPMYEIVCHCDPDTTNPIIFYHLCSEHFGMADHDVAYLITTVLMTGKCVLAVMPKDLAETKVAEAMGCPAVQMGDLFLEVSPQG